MTDLDTTIKPLNDTVINLMSGWKEKTQQQLLARLKTVKLGYRKPGLSINAMQKSNAQLAMYQLHIRELACFDASLNTCS